MMVTTRIAWARARRQPLRGVVMMLGVAVGMAAIVFGAVAAQLSGDAAVRRSILALDPADRSVSLAVSGEGLREAEVAALDAQVARTLSAVGIGTVRRVVFYRGLAVTNGSVVRVVGLDDVESAVTIGDGRLPTACTAGRDGCEVVALTDLSLTELDELRTLVRTSFGVEIVGTAVRRDPLVVAGAFAALPGEIPLVGTTGLRRAPRLGTIRSSLGWVAPLDVDALTTGGVPQLRSTVATLANLAERLQFTVTAPDGQLLDAAFRARASSSRAELPAVQAATLVALFVVLAALSLRSDHRGARVLLQRRGASRRTLVGFALADTLWPIAVGTGLGLISGVGLGGWRATSTGSSWDRAWSAATSSGTIVRLLTATVVLWIVAAVLVATVERARLPTFGRSVEVMDVVGLVAGLLLVFAVQRSSVGVGVLAQRGDRLVALLPLLALAVAAAVAVRAVPMAMQVLRWLVARRRPLAALSFSPLARRRTASLAVVAHVAATSAAMVFAIGYDHALDQGARTDAAFRVPLDVTFGVGRSLVNPSAREPALGWSSITTSEATVPPTNGASDIVATDVLRRAGSLRLAGVAADNVELLGLDRAALDALNEWRDQWGATRAELAAAVEPTQRTPLPGIRLPVDARELHLGSAGDFVALSVSFVLARPDGQWREREVDPERTARGELMIALTDGELGSTIVGLRIGANRFDAARVEHNVGEGRNTFVDAVSASVFLGRLSTVDADGQRRPVEFDWRGWSTDQTVVRTHPVNVAGIDGLSVEVSLQGSSSLLQPSALLLQPPLRAVVDRRTASGAENGRVTVQVAGGQVELQIIEVVERFPGTSGSRFAIVDGAELSRALHARQPATGTPNEVWLAGTTSSARARLIVAARSDRYADLTRVERGVLVDEATSDPLAVMVRWAFLLGAFVAALLAIAALVLAVRADSTDDAPLYRSLLADGLEVRALRHIMFGRAALMVIGAVPIGVVAGWLLTGAVGRIVAVTAAARPPLVPLVTSTPWKLIGGALGALVLVGLVAAWWASRAGRRLAAGDSLRESS